MAPLITRSSSLSPDAPYAASQATGLIPPITALIAEYSGDPTLCFHDSYYQSGLEPPKALIGDTLQALLAIEDDHIPPYLLSDRFWLRRCPPERIGPFFSQLSPLQLRRLLAIGAACGLPHVITALMDMDPARFLVEGQPLSDEDLVRRPIFNAVRGGYVDVVQILLATGQPHRIGWALADACQCANHHLVSKLLLHPRFEQVSAQAMSHAFHLAVPSQSTEVVACLINSQWRDDISCEAISHPLQSISIKSFDLFQILWKYAQSRKIPLQEVAVPALYNAVKHANEPVVSFLLDYLQQGGRTAFLQQVGKLIKEFVVIPRMGKLLWERLGSVTREELARLQPFVSQGLLSAVQKGKVEAVRLIIDWDRRNQRFIPPEMIQKALVLAVYPEEGRVPQVKMVQTLLQGYPPDALPSSLIPEAVRRALEGLRQSLTRDEGFLRIRLSATLKDPDFLNRDKSVRLSILKELLTGNRNGEVDKAPVRAYLGQFLSVAELDWLE